MPFPLIVAAAVTAITTIAAGAMNANAQKEANETNLRLGEQARQDTLEQNMVSNKQKAEALALNQKQQALTEKEAALNRTERNEERLDVRLQRAADRYTQYLNNHNALTQNRMAPLIRRK